MTSTLQSFDAALLAFADDVGSQGPISIAGSQTRWTLGGELEPGTRTISAPTGIVEYTPAEMTVVVRAGTPVSELHAALAEKGQWTALPERGGTVGGAIVVGENDFRRGARGEVRNAVLQVRYVSAEGELVTGGGPTVKNVSGFDLPRLVVGSLGTLGCLAEVTLRTNPIPASIRWFEARNVDPFALHSLLLNPGAIMWNGDDTQVMLHGHDVDVAADVDRILSLGAFSEIDEPESPSGFRWSLQPSELATLDGLDTATFVAEIGVGLLHAEKPQPPRMLSTAMTVIHERLKAEFDRTGRLNPGRTVGST